ncbi:MAG: outer membrane beta-barrel protein [Edaphobacter sp.]
MLIRIFACICLAGATCMLSAQARPTASRTADFQIGGGFTNGSSDYLPNRFNGGAAYFDFDFTRHLGVEGVFHFVKDGKGSDIYEKTYEIGGRYHLIYGRFMPYGKVLYGRGVFNFAAYPGYPHPNLAYNLFAGGAGLDYRVLPYLNARADFEYQRWLGFPPNGLTPKLLTIGLAYHFR